jgi:NADPH:quinone reductase-like Zn-dependent oxidoreductase
VVLSATRRIADASAAASSMKPTIAHVHAVYPLAQTAAALKVLADRKAMGKILLRP